MVPNNFQSCSQGQNSKAKAKAMTLKAKAKTKVMTSKAKAKTKARTLEAKAKAKAVNFEARPGPDLRCQGQDQGHKICPRGSSRPKSRFHNCMTLFVEIGRK